MHIGFGGKASRKEATKKTYRHKWEVNIKVDLIEI
jgi:hypothetical protein